MPVLSETDVAVRLVFLDRSNTYKDCPITGACLEDPRLHRPEQASGCQVALEGKSTAGYLSAGRQEEKCLDLCVQGGRGTMAVGDDQRLGCVRAPRMSMRRALGVTRCKAAARPRDSMFTPAERWVRSVA